MEATLTMEPWLDDRNAGMQAWVRTKGAVRFTSRAALQGSGACSVNGTAHPCRSEVPTKAAQCTRTSRREKWLRIVPDTSRVFWVFARSTAIGRAATPCALRRDDA